MSPNTHLALLALLLGGAQQTDAHRYHRHHHHGRRLFKPTPTFVNNEMAGPFRPFHTYPSGAGGGIFTSAGPLVDVFQEVLGDIKKATRHFSDSTTATMRTPPHEVAETAEAAIITADLPGCKREDVDAQISEEGGSKTLTITAVRKKPVLAANGNPEPSPSTNASDLAESAASPSETAPAAAAPASEAAAAAAPSGPVDGSEKETSSAESCSSSPSPSFTEERFKLSFSVGDGIDTSAIRGSLEDGVLTLVLPKLAPEPPAEPIDIPIDFAAGNVNTNSNDKGAGAGSVAGSGRSGVKTGSAADGETHISLA